MWSPVKKFRTWRLLWIALATAEKELGESCRCLLPGCRLHISTPRESLVVGLFPHFPHFFVVCSIIAGAWRGWCLPIAAAGKRLFFF